MDPSAFTALVKRCAPGHPTEPLVALVRQASGFEPLVIRVVQNGKTISVSAPSRDDAIAFAAESRILGQRVRVGLAGLDTRDLDRLGLTLGEAFDPCANLRAAARLTAEQPRPTGTSLARPPGTVRIKPKDPSPSFEPKPAPPQQTAPAEPPILPGKQARAWDVYGQAFESTAFVYAPRD